MLEALMMRSAHRLAVGAVVLTLTGSTVGCAAKVRQDVFDQTMADLRGEMGELDSRVAGNTDRIDDNQATLRMLRQDLESLSADLGEIEAQITEIENGLRFAMPVHFEFDRANVRTVDEPKLDRFAAVAAKYYPNAVITVEGFADPAGSAAYNNWLSEQRAQNVAAYLTSQAGLDPTGIRTAAYGEDRQVVPGAQGPGPAGMENRRVTFVIEFAEQVRRATVATSGAGG